GRRHTRSTRDWSSDVCSSDLPVSRNCYRPRRSICAWRCVLVGLGQGMDTGPKIAQVAALVGDPARANMLSALMDGRTLTATELRSEERRLGKEGVSRSQSASV